MKTAGTENVESGVTRGRSLERRKPKRREGACALSKGVITWEGKRNEEKGEKLRKPVVIEKLRTKGNGNGRWKKGIRGFGNAASGESGVEGSCSG